MSKFKRGLFWFRHDLRLSDNPSLTLCCEQCDELIFVYILDPSLLKQTEFGTTRLGNARWRFIQESLDNLHVQLASHQQRLIIKVGDAEKIILKLINEYHIDHIGITPHPGFYETQTIETIKAQTDKSINWQCNQSFTLFNQNELPFEIKDLPDSFTQFRKKIEQTISVKTIIEKVVLAPSNMPSANGDIDSDQIPDIPPFTHSFKEMVHRGGEQAAQQQLEYYTYKSQHLSRYKETRNGLDGWDFSTKLSAYLSQGCLSARQVMKMVVDYENQFGPNESTYWLYFELLWRDFYQWHQQKYQANIYLKRGIQNSDPELKFDQHLFNKWTSGETDNNFVNAFMRQLKQTGWMSNRGRQIVASYFVNQLQLDWRYGAAWFEQLLIDYDSSNNWGNWQYLAGVGADPRGRRAFNIEKQRQIYDPDNHFINHYLD